MTLFSTWFACAEPTPAGAGTQEDAGSIADVEEVVGAGVRVDWTHLTLDVWTDTLGRPTQNLEAVEQLGRREVDVAFQQSVGRVRVTSSALLAELATDPGLGAAVSARLPRWNVTEAVYGTSGRVTLSATLSLQDLLQPWATQIAKAGSAPPASPDGPTGLLVDARGTGARPAYCPRLLDPGERPLYAGELYEEQAVLLAPYVFVPDPVHPAAALAGAAPAWVRAVRRVGESDLVLDEAGAARVAELADSLLGRGQVVIVVDPP
jgi:hypothetical protein